MVYFDILRWIGINFLKYLNVKRKCDWNHWYQMLQNVQTYPKYPWQGGNMMCFGIYDALGTLISNASKCTNVSNWSMVQRNYDVFWYLCFKMFQMYPNDPWQRGNEAFWTVLVCIELRLQWMVRFSKMAYFGNQCHHVTFAFQGLCTNDNYNVIDYSLGQYHDS